MTKARKLLSTFIAVIFMAITFLGVIPEHGMAKKVVLPKIKLITGPKAEYELGEMVYLKFNAPNYKKKVQYRVILWDVNKRTQKELWPSMPGYYNGKWVPGGLNYYSFRWPIQEPGTYNITILVKRAYKKVPYDNYYKTINFTIKAKEEAKTVDLTKPGEIYGPAEALKAETINKDVYIKADKVTLRNVNVAGNIIVDPGKDGIATLDNVTAKTIKVVSGAEKSIHLNNVKAEKLEAASDDSKVRIEISKDTKIDTTIVSNATILENTDGTFGKIIILKNSDGKYEVELSGKFEQTIVVEGDVTLKALEKAEISKVEIAPENKDSVVTLEGSFNEVVVKNEVKLVIAENSNCKNIEVNAKAEVVLEKGAVVEVLDKNNNEVKIDNKGTVEKEENTGGTTPGTGGGGVIIVPPAEVTNENTNLNAAVNKVISDMNTYDIVSKVFGTVANLPASGKSNDINITINPLYKEIPLSGLVMLTRSKVIAHGRIVDGGKDANSLSDLNNLLTNTKVTSGGFPEGTLNNYIAMKVSGHTNLNAFFKNMSVENYNKLYEILTGDATKANYDEYTEIAGILLNLIPDGNVAINSIAPYGLTVKSIQLNNNVIYKESDKNVSIGEIKTALGAALTPTSDIKLNSMKKIIVILKGNSSTEYTYTVNFQ